MEPKQTVTAISQAFYYYLENHQNKESENYKIIKKLQMFMLNLWDDLTVEKGE